VRLALALPDAYADRVALDAVRYGHEVVLRAASSAELTASIGGVRPDAAVVWAAPRYLGYDTLADCDSLGVRVVATVADDAQRRYATGIGLYDLVDAEAEWPVVDEVLRRGAVGAPEQARAERGEVVAVWGPAGSPGRTTLAIGVAAELAAAGFSVALADVDTHSASIAPALGLTDEAPGFAAACRLAGADSLNRSELERIGQRHRAGEHGFWVLTGIGQPSRWPELSGERVLATIDECRRWVDYVVLDTASSLENDEEISTDLFAPRRNAATLAAIREADHIVAVASADPVGLSRFLRAYGDLVDVAVTLSVTVVANKVRASAIGMGAPGQVEQTLARFGGIDAPVLVPWDQNAFDAAVLSARTVGEVAPRSAATLAIRRLVTERLLPPTASRRRAVAGSRLWRR
jgi:MinD-like ATPase involved in chromosome partitioning or flagellar assembly